MKILGLAFGLATFFISVVPGQQPVADPTEYRTLENLIRKNGGWSTSSSQDVIRSVRIEACRFQVESASVISLNRWTQTTFQEETEVVAAKSSPAFSTSLQTISFDLREVDFESVSLGEGRVKDTEFIKLPIKGKRELVLTTYRSHSGKVYIQNSTEAIIVLKESVSGEAKSLFTNLIRRCQADS